MVINFLTKMAEYEQLGGVLSIQNASMPPAAPPISKAVSTPITNKSVKSHQKLKNSRKPGKKSNKFDFLF